MSIYSQDLPINAANYRALSPIQLLGRAASTHPDIASFIYQQRRYTWSQTAQRCNRVASSLQRLGVAEQETVAVLAGNIPELFELHFAIAMAGGVINAINTRLNAATVAYILQHGEAKVFMVDSEFMPLLEAVLPLLDSAVKLIIIDHPESGVINTMGDATSYAQLLEEGDVDFEYSGPRDEWDAIALSYTSGTTGKPKGVVTHHRGAMLNAMNNVIVWNMPSHPVYLWTLPMFHCNGWCFPWTMALLAGTNVGTRQVRADEIFAAINDHGVDHLCGAPTVLNSILQCDAAQPGAAQGVKIMTAAAPPPAATLAAIEEVGFAISHVYGLTEVYGPAVVCAEQPHWQSLPADEVAALKSRQGVRYPTLDELCVLDQQSGAPVPTDGETVGEICMRGNIVMKGYLKDAAATNSAFADGWFHSGDLGVCHEDGYIEIKDRAKDIIISGGENISSIEIENAIYAMPNILQVAVVARPDEHWGETPCAFVAVKNSVDISAEQVIEHCRAHLPRFMAPKTVIFGDLPVTSTGKVQKFVLRQRAKAL